MEIFSIGHALLATQRALLDIITPELRAVVVDICEESQFMYIRFYYHGESREKNIDLWQCAITEASAALGPECELDDEVERLDYPQGIPFRGRLAYLRKEPLVPVTSDFSETSIPVVREIVDFKEKIGLFCCPVSGEKIDTHWGVIHYASKGTHIVPAKPPSHKIEIFPLAYALLSIQRALLGIVTPELRAVIADIDADQLLFIRYYYDGNVSNETLEDWECAITETLADLGPAYSSNVCSERVNYPKKFLFRGRFAYIRKEPITSYTVQV